ncbi:hypothetical protein GTA09_16310, partial [Rhodococcus hoagii]|nr:hypothetical protein [Prescottella equi]
RNDQLRGQTASVHHRLNDKNDTEFHRKMDYYIRHASKVGGRQKPRAAPPPRPTVRAPGDPRVGVPQRLRVSTRGRISREIAEAFAAAH